MDGDAYLLGPLRVRSVRKVSGSARTVSARSPLTVVLMHGFGVPGDDLVPFAESLDVPVGTRFVFPEGPLALSAPKASLMIPVPEDARGWYLFDLPEYEDAVRQGTADRLIKEDGARMSSAHEALLEMLAALRKEEGSELRLVLGGFSQGAMLATDITLRTELPLAGLVILSGTLVNADQWRPGMAARTGLPVFQSHGTEDAILPTSLALELRRELMAAGLEIRFELFEGGHGIPLSLVSELGAFLSALS